MGKVYVKASPVGAFSTVQTYNWSAQTPLLGAYDIGAVWTDGNGPYGGFTSNFNNPQSTSAGTLTSAVLPNPIFCPLPGQIITAYEPRLGWGEFIVLRVPTTTAIKVGTFVNWDPTYSVTVNPVTASTGRALAVSVSSATASQVPDTAGGGISSATPVQYAWFQLSGRAWVLKSAVQVTPNGGVYTAASGTFTNVSSTGKMVVGARSGTATTTTTQSLCIVCFDRPRVQGA